MKKKKIELLQNLLNKNYKDNLLKEEAGDKEDLNSLNSSKSKLPIKKLKISKNNYTSNINGYAPLVKKSEIKNNNIFNYYEYIDETGKKIIFKTRVINSNSSDFSTKSNSENNKEIEEKEILRLDTTSKLKDLNDFKWDNIHEYFAKQEKLKMKEKSTENNSNGETISIYAILFNNIKARISQRIERFQLRKIFMIFLVGLIIQLIVSKK